MTAVICLLQRKCFIFANRQLYEAEVEQSPTRPSLESNLDLLFICSSAEIQDLNITDWRTEENKAVQHLN